MKLQDALKKILETSTVIGTYTLSDLLGFAAGSSADGIALAKDDEGEYYLAFLGGEPEGAIYLDEKGALYGDKAVMKITGNERFSFHGVGADLVSAFVMGCRIYEKSHLRRNESRTLPEVGVRSAAMGVFTVTLLRGTVPVNGARVLLRDGGRIVGSDISTGDGSVSFRVTHGHYDCVVQDRDGTILTFPVIFDKERSSVILNLLQ